MLVGILGLGCYALVSTLMLSFIFSKQLPYLNRAYMLQYAVLTLALGLLAIGLLISDWHMAYVYQNSHLSMPAYLKLSALWASHAGSWLLMNWLVASWGMYLIYKLGINDRYVYRYFGGLVAVMVLAQMMFDSPFILQGYLPNNGQELNPLLQDYGMAIHPPMLLAGYLGALIPWVLINAVGAVDRALLRRQVSLSLACLTMGLMLGGWWSYRMLGWGGYWAWDPVENLSLLPWLMQVALLHELRSADETNVRLVAWMGAFSAVAAIFFVRSGLIESVHSFSDQSAAQYFFMLLMWAVMALGIREIYRYINQGSKLFQSSFVIFAVFFFCMQWVPQMMGLAYHLDAGFYNQLVPLWAMYMLWPLMPKKLGAIEYLVSIFSALLAYVWGWSFGAVLVGMSIIGLLQVSSMAVESRLSHRGFLLLIIALCVHSANLSSHQVHIMPHTTYTLPNGAMLRYEGYETLDEGTKSIRRAHIIMDQHQMLHLFPAIRYHTVRDMAVAIPAISIGWLSEWYMVPSEIRSDGQMMLEVQRHWLIRTLMLFSTMIALGLLRRRS